jgi:hypothetical protein
MNELYYDIRNQLAGLKRGRSTLVNGHPELVVKFDKDGIFHYRNIRTTSLAEITKVIVNALSGAVETYSYVAQYYEKKVIGKENKIHLHTFEVDCEMGAKELMSKVVEALPEGFILISLNLYSG